jgi:hypothetical protein
MNSPEQDYITFRDALLIAIADEQEPPGLGAVILQDVVNRNDVAHQPTWLQTVGADYERLGYGKIIFDGHDRFLINGAGLEAATLVRRQLAPKSLGKRISEVPRSDWIAIGAFIVSLVALLK